MQLNSNSWNILVSRRAFMKIFREIFLWSSSPSGRGFAMTKCLYTMKIGCVHMQTKSQIASSLWKYLFRISKFKAYSVLTRIKFSIFSKTSKYYSFNAIISKKLPETTECTFFNFLMLNLKFRKCNYTSSVNLLLPSCS